MAGEAAVVVDRVAPGPGQKARHTLEQCDGVISSAALPSANGRLSFSTTLPLPFSAIDNRSCETGGRRQ